ncbi:hypothetical protein [Streptomyces sp. V1I1]|uniref:hypothetical protein n=1 Tax=Streptomyces sp. V1I1 TaxID=3042272 RepID=UPI0027816A47|nr:hypothetical protein [Streptomyces sp. V1I1]MDQ0940736.1 hypothetical protein [Streptomyces sp. V1I1]
MIASPLKGIMMPGSPTKATDPTSAAKLISDHAIGATVSTFRVFGINSLKTYSDPDALQGQALESVAEVENTLQLKFTRHSIDVDLQRTGSVIWHAIDNTSASKSPTGRLIFTNGFALTFAEPAKTKRIAFWVKEAST